ncbi:GMC oxidoreductase [Schizopora paradoxa]|uniref:GMC oxidoreductase n=1 Tax=Schizopora paradoxa TaxID=27342 RepID=A0A0H2RGY0_9AGAM|nr:GMC oxidoreductase [Schizopora paradoxa]
MAASINEVAGKHFDYVRLQTAGLTIAARLAEDPRTTVAVLEAGPENLDDPMISMSINSYHLDHTMPGQYARHFRNPAYDWCLETTPQEFCGDAVYGWPRGKMLGGSSAINFFGWIKPQAKDIDAWERLGNPGWNWARFQEYAKKAEGFIPPADAEWAKSRHMIHDPHVHGYDGPVKTAYPLTICATEFPFRQTLLNCGIPLSRGVLGGDPIGVSMVPNTIDPITQKRVYATTAYYLPNKDKKNLTVLCDALVHRILSRKDERFVEATSVEFEHGGGIHKVNVRKEVILCAGALKSPQILELSGIGNKSVLESFGIETLVDLPGVGENMQEHSYSMVIHELKPESNLKTLDSLADPTIDAAQRELYKSGKGMYCTGFSNVAFFPLSTIFSAQEVEDMVTEQRSKIDSDGQTDESRKALYEQYKIQLQKIESGWNGDCEILPFPGSIVPSFIRDGKNHMSTLAGLHLPFSRGNIHIRSADPKDDPSINPRSFENDFDMKVLVRLLKYCRNLANVEPWKSIVAKEVLPGPQCQSDEEIEKFIKKSLGTMFHTAGSASMLPRESRGVVDPALIVYGTRNIRVADLSIVPLHVAAHTQATAYAVGEIAADLVKAGTAKGRL